MVPDDVLFDVFCEYSGAEDSINLLSKMAELFLEGFQCLYYFPW